MCVHPELLVCCLAFIVVQLSPVIHGVDSKDSNAAKAYEQMTDTRRGLGALKEVIQGIDDDLQATQKRWAPGCHVGAGMPGYQCHLAALRSDSKAQDWLQANHLSPGKRTATTDSAPSSDAIMWRVRDLATKRKGLDVLKKILQEMDTDLMIEQKRTCSVNLGNHCYTENVASVADQWHYLNSPHSPGRRRRRATREASVNEVQRNLHYLNTPLSQGRSRRHTALYKKLITGELLA